MLISISEAEINLPLKQVANEKCTDGAWSVLSFLPLVCLLYLEEDKSRGSQQSEHRKRMK